MPCLSEQTAYPHPEAKGFVIALLFRPEGLIHDGLGAWSVGISVEKSGQRQGTRERGAKEKSKIG